MYTNKLSGFMGDKDLDYLYRTACNLPKGATIVEIGSWMGKSTEAYVQASFDTKKDFEIHCVDVWNDFEINHKASSGAFKVFMSNSDRWIEKMGITVLPKRMSSQVAYKEFDDRSIDFLFIDGAHDYDSVWADLNNWYDKVKLGGICSGHDYRKKMKEGVIAAVNDFFGKGNYTVNKNSVIWERVKPDATNQS